MAANKKDQLNLYPLDEGQFIGKIWADEPANLNVTSNSIETVIILDRSNSMGDATSRFANSILPLVLEKLFYNRSEQVHFIVFSSRTDHHYITVEGMKTVSASAHRWMDNLTSVLTSEVGINVLKYAGTEAMKLLPRGGIVTTGVSGVSGLALNAIGTFLQPTPGNIADDLTALSTTAKSTFSAPENILMAPAIQQLQSLFQSFDDKKPVRVLTISAEEISDRIETESAATALALALATSNFTINSQGVRVFTSTQQPDTKALCSLLRINNTTPSQICDVNAQQSNEHIAIMIAELFKSDNFSSKTTITMEQQIILKFPWYSKPSSQIMLFPGQNVFWLTDVPTGEITIGDRKVKINMKRPLPQSKFRSLMKTKLAYMMNHLRILKTVGTVDAMGTVDSIVKYFSSREDVMGQTCSLRGSLGKIIHIGAGSAKISDLLAKIANDKNIDKLNPAQMAAYIQVIDRERVDQPRRSGNV